MLDQLRRHRRQRAGAMVILAEVFAGGLKIDQQGDLVAVGFPVLQGQIDPGVAGDGGQMDRCIGRSANGGIDHDSVAEGFRRQDIGRFEVLLHHLDDA